MLTVIERTKTDVVYQVRVPVYLNHAIARFLSLRPDWDESRFLVSAIALFLMQFANELSVKERRWVSRLYLGALFGRE